MGVTVNATIAEVIRFKRFAAFMRDANPVAVYLYEVTPANAAAFVANIQAQLARSTVRSNLCHLGPGRRDARHSDRK